MAHSNPGSGSGRKDPGALQEKETVSDWVEKTKGKGMGDLENNESIGRRLDMVLLGDQDDDGDDSEDMVGTREESQ